MCSSKYKYSTMTSFCLSVTALSQQWFFLLFFFYISKAAKFKKFKETALFAQFDKDLQSVDKMSLTFSTGNVFKPKYKLRVLRVRITHLERKERQAALSDLKTTFATYIHAPGLISTLSLTGLSVDMTSCLRRAKKSPSGLFPVKIPTSEAKSHNASKTLFWIVQKKNTDY